MKISSSQMFRNFNKWRLSALTVLFLAGAFNSQAQGGDLFKAKCATCHKIFDDMTGPKLYGVRGRWEAKGAGEDVIIQWVRDQDKAATMNSYVEGRLKWSGTSMTKFGGQMTDEQIISILDWVDDQEIKVDGEETGGSGSEGDSDESGLGWIWYVVGGLFIVIILSVGGVRRQLKSADAEASGGSFDASMSYADEFKQWAWVNRKYVGLGGLVIVVGLIVTLFLGLYSIGIMEGYQPSQPIEFPHSVHTGENGIDCRYCHNSVTESKTAGIPSVNVCMNCHKQIKGEGAQVAQIQKIYDAAGWDGKKYTNVTKPIIWNKVHVLPDHVYFNHKQHVVVGEVDCIQCHGDMTKMTETAMVQPVSELNKIEGNIPLTKATLTMGWCIECHQEKAITDGPINTKDQGKNGYYNEIHKRLMSGNKALYSEYLEDDKVTVKELGGWECAKCHY
ncbi:MAG: c-type cytochrome [Crocinitomicaceae bacterium]|nr:c-type cytochrome [Crocinitomicaceae bacterium]